MSESIASSAPMTKTPWDLRLLNSFVYCPDSKLARVPHRIACLALGVGAFEGLLLGLIHGGIVGVILCIVWGGTVGVAFGAMAWFVWRRTGARILSLLFGLVIVGSGSFLIDTFARVFAFFPLWKMVGGVSLIMLFLFPSRYLFVMAVGRAGRWPLPRGLRGIA